LLKRLDKEVFGSRNALSDRLTRSSLGGDLRNNDSQLQNLSHARQDAHFWLRERWPPAPAHTEQIDDV
jgi:hypothetical protein